MLHDLDEILALEGFEDRRITQQRLDLGMAHEGPKGLIFHESLHGLPLFHQVLELAKHGWITHLFVVASQ